ncbi:MAG: hypothetical protein K1X57_14280 [Gemmataceae bacterium]|nr:hypothetical protein [Gemmataceae bacterium]
MLRFAAALLLIAAVGLLPAQDKKAADKKSNLPGSKSKLPPEPGYERRQIEGFQVLINKKILDETLDGFARHPFSILEDELRAIGKLMKPDILQKLQTVQIWVEWDNGEAKANGARTIAVYHAGSMLAYIRGQSNTDPRKGNQIEVVTLKFLSELKQPGRDKQQVVLLHELIHAVHDKVLGRDHPEIVAAFKQAQERKLYESVEHRNGPKREAYANTNHVEYFAEISCMFLDKIDYHPYDRDGLKGYDPEGYKLAEKVWGKAIAKPKPEKAKAAPTPTPTPAIKAEAPKPADPEKAAAGKLDLIRELIKDGKKDRAKERLAELIRDYPMTKAAGEAQTLLDSLK